MARRGSAVTTPAPSMGPPNRRWQASAVPTTAPGAFDPTGDASPSSLSGVPAADGMIISL